MCRIERADGRVLALRRTKSDWPGLTFPGGHVEAGESLQASVCREVFEETGLTIERPRLVGVKDFMDDAETRYIVFLYEAKTFSGELRASAEGELLWLNRSEMAAEAWSNSFREMLEVFENPAVDELWWSDEPAGWVFY